MDFAVRIITPRCDTGERAALADRNRPAGGRSCTAPSWQHIAGHSRGQAVVNRLCRPPTTQGERHVTTAPPHRPPPCVPSTELIRLRGDGVEGVEHPRLEVIQGEPDRTEERTALR